MVDCLGPRLRVEPLGERFAGCRHGSRQIGSGRSGGGIGIGGRAVGDHATETVLAIPGAARSAPESYLSPAYIQPGRGWYSFPR